MSYQEIFDKNFKRLEKSTIQELVDSYESCSSWCDYMEEHSKDGKAAVPITALASLKAQFTFIANILKEIE